MLCCVVATIFFVAGCKDSEAQRTEKEEREARWLQSKADHSISRLKYIKDPRTNLCFSILVHYESRGLSEVPCEKIPPHMLTTAQVN